MKSFDKIKYFLNKKKRPYQAKPNENSPHIDPVCKMKVNSDTPYVSAYAGQTYYFCSQSCFEKFLLNKDFYAMNLKNVS